MAFPRFATTKSSRRTNIFILCAVILGWRMQTMTNHLLTRFSALLTITFVRETRTKQLFQACRKSKCNSWGEEEEDTHARIERDQCHWTYRTTGRQLIASRVAPQGDAAPIFAQYIPQHGLQCVATLATPRWRATGPSSLRSRS